MKNVLHLWGKNIIPKCNFNYIKIKFIYKKIYIKINNYIEAILSSFPLKGDGGRTKQVLTHSSPSRGDGGGGNVIWPLPSGRIIVYGSTGVTGIELRK